VDADRRSGVPDPDRLGTEGRAPEPQRPVPRDRRAPDEAGTADRPLRVAIVGAGPAGFYTLQALVRPGLPAVQVDMFDALPTPFGLVRQGVAPDHPKIKSVAAVYHRLAQHAGFRFYGNVEFGRDLERSDLESCYDQIVFCTGAQADRRLDVPGEDLPGSYSATEFVAWYNGHPDYSRHRFDLSRSRAVIIGAGNVAVDVARILCRAADELAATDIADHALEALRQSAVRAVQLVGRRGPLQAAFTSPEVAELGELADTATTTLPEEVALDAASRRALEAEADKEARRKLEILTSYARPAPEGKSRRLAIRFLLSPVEILGDEAHGVNAVRFVRNELYEASDGGLRSRPTARDETIEAGLVFRAIGYRGIPLPGLPFDDGDGRIPNRDGRVVDPATGAPIPGLYVSGWIKRGPTGVIGTNKLDAAETVGSMLEDLAAGRRLQPTATTRDVIGERLEARGVRFVTYRDWMELDAREIARGAASGRPRVKFVDRKDLLATTRRR